MRLQTALQTFLKPQKGGIFKPPKKKAASSRLFPLSQADNALQLRYYQLILERLPVGVMISQSGRIRSMNYVMRVFFNLSSKGFLSPKITDIFPVRKEIHALMGAAEKAIRQHVPMWQTVASLTDATGECRRYRVWTVLLNVDVKAPLVCWVFQDVTADTARAEGLRTQVATLTESKQALVRQARETQTLIHDLVMAREAAEMANQTKTAFLANVSHELRTPLNAILGFAEAIESETFGPLQNSQYRTYLGYITAAGRHLLSLINDILDLSGLESGKHKLQDKTVRLETLLTDVLALISRYPEAQQRHISMRLLDKEILLKADERALRQIFLNLLSNAIKFTGQDGRIGVSVSRLKNGGIKIGVKDNGIGIPKDKIKKLFQPFVQIENSQNRTHQGTGLGLVLVKKLVEMHQGRVQLKSKLNTGTHILVEFPAERVIK